MIQRELMACPICDGVDFVNLCEPVKVEEVVIPPAVRCNRCGLGMEHQLSGDPFQYGRSQYDQKRDKAEGVRAWARYHHDTAVAGLRYQQLQSVLPKQHPNPSWLDVGCNNGAMLAFMRRKGWNVAGVEADSQFCEEVNAVSGIAVLPYPVWIHSYWRSIEDARSRNNKVNVPSSFTVVSFFDVLEHLLDIVSAVKAAIESTSIGGIVIVEAPDLDAVEGDFANWKHRRITPNFTEHIWHFSEKSLVALFDQHAGYGRVVAIHRPIPGRLQFVWRKLAMEQQQQ